MSGSSHNDQNERDVAADRALREGLRTPGLSAEAMQRIRQATQQEWRAVTQTESTEVSRRPERRWWSLAAAASVAVIAGVLGWNTFIANPVGEGAVVGEL